MPQANSPAPARRNIVVLGMLSTFGPISLDLYLPALPQLAAELEASPSAAQLTITACLIGLAVGQVVVGPLSDRFGRKRPLMIGLVAYAVTSLACAFAWSISVLVLFRLIQGLAGAAGIVIARAVARDLHEGRQLVIFFSRLVLVSGLAPAIAPVLGGQLNRVMTWRGIFGVLAGIGVVLVLAGWLGLKESLPREKRVAGGVLATLRGFAALAKDRFFVGVALAAGLAGASMFAYIAGGTFVLQRIYGLSPQLLAGFRAQLAGHHGGCAGQRTADPTVVAGTGPEYRSGHKSDGIALPRRLDPGRARVAIRAGIAVRDGQCHRVDPADLHRLGAVQLSGAGGNRVGVAGSAAIRRGRPGRAAGRPGRRADRRAVGHCHLVGQHRCVSGLRRPGHPADPRAPAGRRAESVRRAAADSGIAVPGTACSLAEGDLSTAAASD